MRQAELVWRSESIEVKQSEIGGVELHLGKVKCKHFIHVRRQVFKDGIEDNLIAKSEKCFSLGFSNHSKTECGSKEEK